MGDFTKIVVAIVFLFMTYVMYKRLKANPEALSKENLNRSFYSMGILALLLIGLVFLMVSML